MNELSDDERDLLRYYAETERIIHGSVRGAVHQHLLRNGYIEERPINPKGALIVVTAAGRRALSRISMIGWPSANLA
jgi:hypothetical protein